MAEWGLKHAKGMSLRYDEIAAFETLFRATFCGKLTLFRATFLFGISWGKKCFVFVGRFLGDFITLWSCIFLRNLIYYDEYETCDFDFCADGGGAAVGGSK